MNKYYTLTISIFAQNTLYFTRKYFNFHEKYFAISVILVIFVIQNIIYITFMTAIILTTPEQIREIVAGAVADAMKETTQPTPKEERPDVLTFEQAHEFLRENGYKLSESTMRVYTHKKILPYKKIGKMAVYSRRDLLKWIESKTTRNTPITTKDDAVLRIAQSASKKM